MRTNQKKMVFGFAGDASCRLMIFSNFEIAISFALFTSLSFILPFSIDWRLCNGFNEYDMRIQEHCEIPFSDVLSRRLILEIKMWKKITFSMLTINYIWMEKPSEREQGRAYRRISRAPGKKRLPMNPPLIENKYTKEQSERTGRAHWTIY